MIEIISIIEIQTQAVFGEIKEKYINWMYLRVNIINVVLVVVAAKRVADEYVGVVMWVS